ncbi:DUF1998 domain-containing protein [Haloarchaeobius sp. TZWSO28]|uniref:DUF1998 domain-containing protein n=1 Tax=Haloarchaeobius sp. TZWSO28 TaxID=3446119 RepID=UPI003EB90AB9
MSGDSGESDRLSNDDRIGRLQGIRKQMNESDIPYMDLANIFGADPAANPPYVIPETFISEEVGGSLTVIEDENEEVLGQENTNQVLNNFLPGGYKKRWGRFQLWRGSWNVGSEAGVADIGQMFDWARSYPLTELLGDVSTVNYTELSFDPEDVRVYVPRTIRVEDLVDPDYVWLEDEKVVWTGKPPMRCTPLSSDPTTNYLWFKHTAEPLAKAEQVPAIAESDVVTGVSFDDDHEFVRCYYASLLTLYPRGTTHTRSGIITYSVGEDESTAFVGTRERSQVLSLELDRKELRSRIKAVLADNPRLKRDLKFAFLHQQLWERLFFQEEAIEHEFAVKPLFEHLVGADFWRRTVEEDDHGVFGLSGPNLVQAVEELLPSNSPTRLRLLGHEGPDSSLALQTVRYEAGTLAELLARCRNEELVAEFAEDVLVHSAEHALATWATESTGSGTSFELWYDLNFQASGDSHARISIYDAIEGGAGIAKEVAELFDTDDNIGIEAGLSVQGECHSATADRAAINLLADHPDGSLYDIQRTNGGQFDELVRNTLHEQVSDRDAFSEDDLHSLVTARVRRLFETRELARFYSYLAARHEELAEELGRTPRTADLALFLDRHVFQDPSIQATYDRFASETGRKDIAELEERLEELTVGCLTACPDCLQTEVSRCLKATGHQETTLNRRLLTEVFDQ